MSETVRQVIGVTEKWLQDFVIRHNLCPFASAPFRNRRIRITSYDGVSEELLAAKLAEEILLLQQADPKEVETSILVTPRMFTDFSEYNQFLDVADVIIAEINMAGLIQVASFHPAYQFADLAQNDVRNYTNRSPYPMFHLIREDSIESARYAMDVDSIPERNMDLLQKMGLDEVVKQQKKIMAS